MTDKKIHIYTDGGSRGNPGPAGIGIVFCDGSGKTIHEHKKAIGRATNNEAEYSAILEALNILEKSSWLAENDGAGRSVDCFLDSQLVVEQLNGRYKVKQPHIAEFVNNIKAIIIKSDLKISFTHIPREKNKEADRLVNEALDEQKGE